MDRKDRNISRMDIINLADIIKKDPQNIIDDSYLKKITGSTLSKETLSFIKIFLDEFQSSTILEFGSGLSTILISDMIHTRKECKFFSVDNIKKFLDYTKSDLKYPDSVRLIHAPAEVSWFNFCPFVTYSSRFLNQMKDIEKIDLVFIDGPYGKIFRRDAPLFLVFHKLKKNSVILLDDSSRPREQEALVLWKNMWGESIEIIEIPEFHKGLAIILVKESPPAISFSTRFRLFKIIDSCSALWNNHKYMKTIKI